MGAASALDNVEDQKPPSGRGIFNRLPGGLQGHFIAMIAEFMGTFLFLFFAFAGMFETMALTLNGLIPSRYPDGEYSAKYYW
jgi:hypothetical protein